MIQFAFFGFLMLCATLSKIFACRQQKILSDPGQVCSRSLSLSVLFFSICSWFSCFWESLRVFKGHFDIFCLYAYLRLSLGSGLEGVDDPWYFTLDPHDGFSDPLAGLLALSLASLTIRPSGLPSDFSGWHLKPIYVTNFQAQAKYLGLTIADKSWNEQLNSPTKFGSKARFVIPFLLVPIPSM